MTVVELYWIHMVLKDLHIPLAKVPHIWCDNLDAITLASNPIFHARAKHVEVDVYFIQEKVFNKDVVIKFLSTHDQIANIFTKGLTFSRFLFLKSKFMLGLPPIRLRRHVNEPSQTIILEEAT